jgi:fructosamine-3-kinase
VCVGLAEDLSYIVLECLDLGEASEQSMSALGEQLAAMHQTQQSQYGWIRDNTIGSTEQYNTPLSNWVEFWQTHRLGMQLELAGQKGYRGTLQKKGDKLMEKMSGLFIEGNPSASLLHGDLWSGNMAVLNTGMPVIFDPAVYYGDRETDIAMTELFGGYTDRFYQSYNDHYPLDLNYSTRKTFYNTYHILNHLNLFGGGYGQQAESMMEQVLSELG